MKRLLIVSDSPVLYSGLARVTRELAKRLSSHYEVTVGGWHHLPSRGVDAPYKIIPLQKVGDHKPLARAITNLKPDVVLAIGDPWDFEALALMRTKADFRLVGYLNIESASPNASLEQTLDAFDTIVTTSEFGRQVLKREGMFAIHHGVDTSVFHPLPNAKKDQGTLGGYDLEKTFVVLLNGQNTERKNLGTALKGFALFAQQKTDVLCFANTMPSPPPTVYPGIDMAPLIAELGIERKVVFNPTNHGPIDCCSDEDLNEIYGVSDVLLVTSLAEGFCLPLLEAMATATLPIAPDAYSATELLASVPDRWYGMDTRGVLMKVDATIRGSHGEMVAVSASAVASALETAYDWWKNHPHQLEQYQNAGLAYATTHSWDATAQGILNAIATPSSVRVADGNPIDPVLRARVRNLPARRIGALKVGGLGDMLQTTAVVSALHRTYGMPITVFANDHLEVFEEMPEVARVVKVPNQLQETLTRSIADEFTLFADVRYVSRLYGAQPTEFFLKHRFFYDNWIHSVERLDDLGMHTTDIMLASLGLEGSPTPIFEQRTRVIAVDLPKADYVVVATGVGSLGGLKRWPHWDHLSRLIGDSLTLVQVGGKQDEAVHGAVDCRGLTLAETAYVIDESIGFVAVEGGMAHLATAVGKRGVVLFGPTNPTLFGYPENQNLWSSACRPCWWSTPSWSQGICPRGEAVCLNHVEAGHVMAGIDQMLVELVP